MPAFLKVRRNQMIIGGVLVLLVLVLVGLLTLLQPKSTPTNTIVSGLATVTPPPSPDVSPSPSASAVPSPGAPTIGPPGAFLHSGQAPDDSSNPKWGQNGPPSETCAAGGTWHHAGWMSDGCQLVLFGGSSSQDMAWVVEHKNGTPNQKRVSVLKGTNGPWVTALYFIDDTCCNFVSMTAKAADITGDGRPEIVVGIRSATTNHILQLDGVRRTGSSDPLVIVHRELVNGKAVLGGGNSFTDYSAVGDHYTKTVVTYGGSSFTSSSSMVATAPPGDFP
jgi:hypothetical protein